MIVCGILLSAAYFLYWKFIKQPAIASKKQSSPKGQELLSSHRHEIIDKLDEEEN